MNLFNYLSLAVIATLLGGCSYKAGEFFEDLFAENRVVKSEGQFTGSIPADVKAPILTDQKKKRKIKSTSVFISIAERSPPYTLTKISTSMSIL